MQLHLAHVLHRRASRAMRTPTGPWAWQLRLGGSTNVSLSDRTLAVPSSHSHLLVWWREVPWSRSPPRSLASVGETSLARAAPEGRMSACNPPATVRVHFTHDSVIVMER